MKQIKFLIADCFDESNKIINTINIYDIVNIYPARICQSFEQSDWWLNERREQLDKLYFEIDVDYIDYKTRIKSIQRFSVYGNYQTLIMLINTPNINQYILPSTREKFTQKVDSIRESI